MAVKPNILFVLSEGLQSTVIDSQVLQHARVLKDQGIAEFTIVTLACNDAAFSQAHKNRERAQNVSGSKVMVLRGVRPGLPFSEWINGWRLVNLVMKYEIQFDKIHARTEYTAALCSVLADKSKKGLIWDCRGDFFAERVDRIPSGIKKIFMKCVVGMIYRRRLTTVAKNAESAIFVTNILREKMRKYWSTKKRSAVIPGAASDKLFFFDANLRQSIRRKLKIEDDTLLLVYSGSMVEYQKFPETLAGFDKLKAIGRKTHYLVVTNQKEHATKLVGSRRNVSVISAYLEEMNGYLNAADAAFMIRDHLPLNAVAFPTKFSEYGLCGLPVIMNSALPDAFALAEQAKNQINPNSIAGIKVISNSERQKVASFYRDRVTKQAQAKLYEELYTVS